MRGKRRRQTADDVRGPSVVFPPRETRCLARSIYQYHDTWTCRRRIRLDSARRILPAEKEVIATNCIGVYRGREVEEKEVDIYPRHGRSTTLYRIWTDERTNERTERMSEWTSDTRGVPRLTGDCSRLPCQPAGWYSVRCARTPL